jgi:site-specific DNA recombinase
VQDLLKTNRITRRIKHSESGALLRGKLFDDKGNAMSSSFSAKNGIRYRFYVSTALRGRKDRAGSVTRVSAPEIERTIEGALLRKLDEQGASAEQVWDLVERAVVGTKSIRVS